MERERKRRMPWIIVILLTVIVCTLSYLGALLIHALTEGDSFGSYSVYAGRQGSEVQIAGNGFVNYDGSKLTYVDSGGNVVWTYLAGADVEFCAGKYGVAAWTENTLTLIDIEKGVATFSGVQDENIVSAKMGAKYAAVLLEPVGDGSIVIMETGGQRIYTADFPRLNVVDYGFFSTGEYFWAMALDTTGSVPTCEISTYKPSSMRIVGAISDTEQLMYNVTFQSSSICTSGVTYFKVYDYTGTEQENLRKLIYGWYLLSADDISDPMLAYVPTGQSDGTESIRDVRMVKSGVDQIVRMPFACTSIVAISSYVYGFSSDGHIMVARAGRQKVNAYQLPFAISEVFGVTEDGHAVVSSGGSIIIVSLIE